jgi:superfamily II DNA or RNA helicase
MVFVDRRTYIERLQKEFPKALVIHWDSDKEKVIEEAKSKDEFLLLGMVSASWEWFDVPSIQCWVLFYSTSWKGSIEQMVGRSRRFYWDKKYGYRVDFQDYGRVGSNEYAKNFWASNRMKIYKENKREIFNWQEFLNDGI